MFSNFLIAGIDVAFDHQPLYQAANVVGVAAAVKHLFGDANLFLIVLVGIAVVHIHDAGGIL